MSEDVPPLSFPPRFRILEEDSGGGDAAPGSDCSTPPPGWVFLGKVAVNGQVYCRFEDLQGILHYVEC